MSKKLAQFRFLVGDNVYLSGSLKDDFPIVPQLPSTNVQRKPPSRLLKES